MEEGSEKKRLNSHALVLIALHVLLLVYSLCAFFSKNASMQPFFSFWFFAYYAGMLGILGIYAVGWQQILKRLPLTVAFANKAIVVVWTILWGVVFFGETVKPSMVIGAAIVIAGIVLFSIADGEERKEAEALAGAPAEPASAEPTRAESSRAERATGESAHAEPAHAEHANVELLTAEPADGEGGGR